MIVERRNPRLLELLGTFGCNRSKLRIKRTSPRQDPWGTPQRIDSIFESGWLIGTACDWLRGIRLNWVKCCPFFKKSDFFVLFDHASTSSVRYSSDVFNFYCIYYCSLASSFLIDLQASSLFYTISYLFVSSFHIVIICVFISYRIRMLLRFIPCSSAFFATVLSGPVYTRPVQFESETKLIRIRFPFTRDQPFRINFWIRLASGCLRNVLLV